MKDFINNLLLIESMNGCVVYFSRTGNTKHLAQAIADTAKAPIFDIDGTLPSTIETYDLLILGTPVEGSSPAKETKTFIERMTKAEGKKAILFLHIPHLWKRKDNESNRKRAEKQRLRDNTESLKERHETRQRSRLLRDPN
jgi:flavodoxin